MVVSWYGCMCDQKYCHDTTTICIASALNVITLFYTANIHHIRVFIILNHIQHACTCVYMRVVRVLYVLRFVPPHMPHLIWKHVL